MEKYIITLDEGTTNARALITNHKGEIIAVDQMEFTQHFPHKGWVEHEAIEIWNKESGLPIYNAIVWQDQRTAEYCETFDRKELDLIREKTGLIINLYFSGTKVKWILDNVKGARELAKQGKLMFGTINTWLIYRLTGGEVFL